MFISFKSIFPILAFYFLLFVPSFLSAEDKFFSLNEKWSLELIDPITAIELQDLNANHSQEILIGSGSGRHEFPYHGFLYIASDSARDIIATSAQLPYGISCIDVGDLGQNGSYEILVGTWIANSGQLFIFSYAELDTYVTAPETGIAPVVSVKMASVEESTLVYVATSEYQGFWDLGYLYIGTGYLDHFEQIHSSMAVPQQLECANLDVDDHHELVWGDFYWFWMTSVHGTSAHIHIRSESPDDTIGYVTTLFDFHGFYWGTDDGGFTSLEIGNCDGDSSLEILGGAFVDTCGPGQDGCCVIVLSAVDGSVKAEQWRATYFGKDNVIRGIALVDFNNDGINEVLVAHQNGPMELLNGEDGSKIAESDSSFRVDHFAFGDVDGDGEKETVIADGNILRVLEPDFSTDVPEEAGDLAVRNLVTLGQNYPNPFNSFTSIPLKVRNPAHINVAIYNILGQKVKTLHDEEKIPGNYQVIWDGENDQGKTVPSGIYFYKLTSGKYSESKKMLLLK